MFDGFILASWGVWRSYTLYTLGTKQCETFSMIWWLVSTGRRGPVAAGGAGSSRGPKQTNCLMDAAAEQRVPHLEHLLVSRKEPRHQMTDTSRTSHWFYFLSSGRDEDSVSSQRDSMNELVFQNFFSSLARKQFKAVWLVPPESPVFVRSSCAATMMLNRHNWHNLCLHRGSVTRDRNEKATWQNEHQHNAFYLYILSTLAKWQKKYIKGERGNFWKVWNEKGILWNGFLKKCQNRKLSTVYLKINS